MLKKAIHFIKYNNLFLLILALVFILGASVFASETGQELLGQKQTTAQGIDNSLLLSTDIDKLDMGFKIEKIEADEKYYYVTYTYLDLAVVNDAWQYQLKEKVRKATRGGEDLGLYLAEEFREFQAMRIKELKAEQAKAQQQGEQKRMEVAEYSGLIGKALNLAGEIIPGYEPIMRTEIPSPVLTDAMRGLAEASSTAAGNDSLENIYKEYIRKNDPDQDNFFGTNDNCPDIANTDQLDSDADGIGDACEDGSSETAAQPAPAEVATTTLLTSENSVEVITPTQDPADTAQEQAPADSGQDSTAAQQPDNAAPVTQ